MSWTTVAIGLALGIVIGVAALVLGIAAG